MLNQVAGIVIKDANIQVPFGLTGILSTLCSIFKNILLILSGMNALNFKTIYAGGIDNLVSKNM